MEEIKIKLDIPSELKPEFELALSKVVKQFVRRVRFSILDDTMSKSELTDAQIEELASKAKERAAKKGE